MIVIGEMNLLRAARRTPQGIYLVDDRDGDEVLLPNNYIPEDLNLDDEIDVFVHHDSENRPIATTLIPKLKVDGFAFLEAKQMTEVGVFMETGLAKDLLIPPPLMAKPMQVGKTYLVYTFKDKVSGRLVGTTKIREHLKYEYITVKLGEEVDLMVYDITDLGYKVVINEKHEGLLYKNEVFSSIRVGDTVKGYIKAIREDGKIDVRLQRSGIKGIEPTSQKIMDKLLANKGVLRLNDNSDPADIIAELQMSKKAFKKAIGNLYKQRLIRIAGDGIHLVEKKERKK